MQNDADTGPESDGPKTLIAGNTFADPQNATTWSRTRSWSLRILIGALWLLMVTTWPLWAGQSDFPGVPLISWFTLPVALDRAIVFWFLIATFLAFLLQRSGTSGREYNVSLLHALAPAVLLVLLNQHRLQPWFWLVMIGLTSGLLPAKDGIILLRANISSMYIFSALSRYSTEIAQGMSGEIARTLLSLAGLQRAAGDPAIVASAAWWFLIAEFLIGCGLFWTRVRWLSVCAAVVLHLSLIVALGPAGLQHEFGVLLWNAMLIVLIPVVFAENGRSVYRSDGLTQSADERRQRTRQRSTRLLAGLLILTFAFPASGLFGIADNWLSWQLYSSRPEVLKLLIPPAAINELPKSLQPWVSRPDPVQDLCFVRLDRWSLQQTGAPMYPEDRFQWAVIDQVTAAMKAPSQRRVVIESPDRLRWWIRHQAVVQGTQ